MVAWLFCIEVGGVGRGSGKLQGPRKLRLCFLCTAVRCVAGGDAGRCVVLRLVITAQVLRWDTRYTLEVGALFGVRSPSPGSTFATFPPTRLAHRQNTFPEVKDGDHRVRSFLNGGFKNDCIRILTRFTTYSMHVLLSVEFKSYQKVHQPKVPEKQKRPYR